MPGLQVGSKREHTDHSCMEWQCQGWIQKLKGNDNTKEKYVEVGNAWDLENAT